MTREEAEHLWNEWTRMWNEDPSIALRLAAPRFHLHLALGTVDPQTIDTPERVRDWVTQFCARYERLAFTTGAGPMFDAQLGTIAGPWIARSRIDGVDRSSSGIDIVRVVDGKIAEYWTLSREVETPGTWNEMLSQR